MRLTWTARQRDQVLDELYEEWDTAKSFNHGPTIVRLLQRLRAEGPPDWTAIALTSSDCWLYLLADDGDTSRRFVRFTGSETHGSSYQVEYQLPERHNPWPPEAAWVAGEPQSEDEAVRMILLGMEHSEGWTRSS